MPVTLFHGRLSNTPARSFSFSQASFQAIGFSPELKVSVENGKVTTEPLAGTELRKGTEVEVNRLRQDLLNDPKEIVEHVLSVKAPIGEIHQVVENKEGTIMVEDLMSVRSRCSV
ncbi:uncharacterized protein ATNIH1004_003591 [Aspergillus tanneri]|uniref:Chorismate-utilising enzyme C-terminal domain-containing protein n=1 Tax=Aspergillus tanneri TaxID=1220188 RepID=A0A5M9MUW5_9EURO|nr:uncharacterized protein ATNIH1004_003591 [Aspergillus tanneri]KAA8650902.1 hypothetical protein ATNIH1004_003591 [Aspergillus tanneri]